MHWTKVGLRTVVGLVYDALSGRCSLHVASCMTLCPCGSAAVGMFSRVCYVLCVQVVVGDVVEVKNKEFFPSDLMLLSSR